MDESTEDDTRLDTERDAADVAEPHTAEKNRPEDSASDEPSDPPESATAPVEAPDGEPTEPEHPVESEQAEPEHRADRRIRVLLLGSTELSGELAVAFRRLGAVVAMHDGEELDTLVDRVKPQYVIAESGAIAADAMIALAERGDVEVFPTPRSTRLGLDREGLRRLASDELGLPTVPFWFAGSAEELAMVADHAGFPLVVTPVVGVPAEGQSVLVRPGDVKPAWHRAVAADQFSSNRVMAERIVEVDYEISLLTVRTTGPSGPAVYFCEPIGHYHGDGDVLQAWQPQPMTPAALDAAKSIAARIVNSLGGRGVFSVELLVRGDEVYFADVHAEPHQAGLVTLRSQRLSEFELHARAILGLAVDTIMISPGAVEVVYPAMGGHQELARQRSGSDRVASDVLAEALSVPESDVRLFEHADASLPRILGVALATGPNVVVARERARHVAAALRALP